MKKNLLKIAIITIVVFASAPLLKAQGVAIYGGLSTPNNEVANVYNSGTTIGNLKGSMDLGFHVGARYRMPLAAGALLSGGVSWNRFPKAKIELVGKNPLTNTTDTATIESIQNIIPVALGIDYVVFNKGLGMFVGGELAYNYLSTTTEFISGDNRIPYDKSPTQNRVGGGVGLGVFFDAKIATAIVDVKYNMVNLIGKEDNEPAKNYVTLSLGVMLGGM